jgi:hypothetical protein
MNSNFKINIIFNNDVRDDSNVLVNFIFSLKFFKQFQPYDNDFEKIPHTILFQICYKMSHPF